MATILVLDPTDTLRGFSMATLRRSGHSLRVLADPPQWLHAVATDRPDVLVLVDQPPVHDALESVDFLNVRAGEFDPSTIVLASDARKRVVHTAADLVLPLRASEALLTNAVNLVLQGRARDQGLMIHPSPPARQSTDPTPIAPIRDNVRQPPEVAITPTGAGRSDVNGYRILRPLGRGGMAVVYLARHEETGQDRVLKLLPISEHDGGDLVQRLINEAVLLAQIDHPSVARIHEHGFTDWHAYIAMEYLPGGDLRTLLSRPVSAEFAADAIVQLAGALDAIHAAGIVHRDLKPENILLRADGTLVLVDFGIARQAGVQLSYVGSGLVVGTAAYVAPEYVKGVAVDGRADLYSLGVLLHEMLTGRKPYESRDPVKVLDMHVHAPIPCLPPSHAWAQPVIDGTMAKSPDDRFATAAALVHAMRDAVAARHDARSLAAMPAGR